MPYQTSWAEPDRFLEHRGVTVFHTYKGVDIDQGTKRFHFTVEPGCSLEDARCEQEPCRHVFDVRELATWREPEHPPYCTGANDTPENRAAWDRYRETESQAIHTAIVAAIDSGELTAAGHQVPTPTPQ